MDPRFVEAGSSWYVSPVAGERDKVIKAGAGKLFYIRVANTAAAVRYIFIVNDDDVAAVGTDLLSPPIPIAANGMVELKLPYPITYGTGLLLSMSTTQTSYTAGGANDGHYHALFK